MKHATAIQFISKYRVTSHSVCVSVRLNVCVFEPVIFDIQRIVFELLVKRVQPFVLVTRTIIDIIYAFNRGLQQACIRDTLIR